MPRFPLRFAAVPLVLALLTAAPAAQVAPVYSRGTAGLVLALERLRTTASALHTAAHPDDEDTALIARLARGDHARVAYLSLNRGEGGQNIIGTELFDALGVIRTEELLQARTLDGGEQFFTRAYDFGFTKTPEEAAEKWHADVIVGDMVRVIRAYRPLVILNGWSGTPADGHGQHQLAGKLAPLAFAAAADPAKYPEQLAEGLRPWQARKLYMRQGFSPDAAPPTLREPTGILDPVLGRTYFEIAMEGRSQHKSQEMGVVEARGPKASNLILVTDLTDTAKAKPAGTAGMAGAPPADAGVFEGIDTSVTGLAALAGLPAGSLAAELTAIDAAARTALLSPDLVRAPAKLVPGLARGLSAARAALAAVPAIKAPDAAKAEATFLLDRKVAEFEDALVRAAGVVVDPLSDREVAAPGDTIRVSVNLFVPDGSPVVAAPATLALPAGWTPTPAAAATPAAGTNPIARLFREQPTRAELLDVHVPAEARFSEPYWLRTPRTGPVFTWTGVAGGLQGRPFDPPDVVARVPLTIGGVQIVVERGLQFRYADSVRGEIRRHVDIVPAVTVAIDDPLAIVPAGAAAARPVGVRVRSETVSDVQGIVRLQAPAGWQVAPATAPVAFGARGEGQAVTFTVTPPAGVAPGAYPLSAQAVIDGRTFDQTMQTIDYPHIQKHRLYAPAQMTARVLDLQVAPVKVGYVMGGGDRVPEAIRRLGLPVTLLTDDDLASGDLGRYDTIVIGVRASEARPAFVAANARLLQYVRDGGTLIVQYQQGEYTARRLAPFPAGGNVRVTDERAPVRILVPDHPVFTTPNRITDADWNEWVQERNLYAWATFDPQYTPLLETADPNEPAQRGGELYAKIGKGHYVYTSYAWFRQLPAGVPGAYRLFANLLSLGAK
jgi:LmbE family N-acetylglucosaminyl deacetylase